ncbi:forkhead box protein N3 isoform X1 [Tribolium castaneum]|nr:PREDICTED: forkhead box protein N3 isoform X1 [Tribolium castaneum]XP_008191761.1 PREDICTED: forkhead box protein N3 isoform X1 [Tribolium castaneum]XP_008191763.1 PREDICTED: forkhead box protein N3 isoform X1 [Tribolium castaneum]XP_015834592.1 PREDICTED: forkhead box protein N3 isoform X1 [Tribolium castaneum]KYB27821.1 Forkhead box protein N3-like Protein [Tribolium castaneum]|eukprot:XP_008191760.1 PREDICTED: forkhead box protein N3 isoform X1 [Tribolium castaneum]
MSPERSNSPQDEAVMTPKMSVPASPVAGTPIREAQSPISLLLAVAQSQSRNGDDDLTSLSWLHERDLLKGMNINPSPSNSVNSTPVKYSNSLLSDQFPTSDYVDDSSISAADSSSSSLNSPVPYNNSSQRNKHPHNVPYDPLVHTNNKPPYSFSCLIFMAIEDSPQKALPVKEIYAWILEHFPYFKNAPTGWKNSVRHNLSLNKCFQKVEKAPNLGKGSLWTVDQQYKPNLIQALTRSPFHPCSTLDPSTYFNNNNKSNLTPEKSSMSRLPNPELYPYLSRKLASAELNNRNIKSENSDESLDAVDAAAVMLSLKNGPRYRQKKEKALYCQVITTSPSQDHTYSAADSVDPLGTDEAFESDDERTFRVVKSRTCRKIDFEDEEERKIKEGAETLLNLAGITTRKRFNSQSSDYEPYKRIKLSPQYDINDNEATERPTPFKPRLLRAKKKEGKSKMLCNNNDEWVRHRRELEINQHR